MTERDLRDTTGPKAVAPAVVDQPVRKRRLWALACVQRLCKHWNGFGDFYSDALDTGERYADDNSVRAAVVATRRRVAVERREIEFWHHDEFPYHYSRICRAAWLVLDPGGVNLAELAVTVSDASHSIHERADWVAEDRAYVDFACCVFGGLPRPADFDPQWRTDTGVSLAAGIYDSRHFDRLPILADALEDAGCDAAELLNHLRGPGPHARGCWPVDLVLGKG